MSIALLIPTLRELAKRLCMLLEDPVQCFPKPRGARGVGGGAGAANGNGTCLAECGMGFAVEDAAGAGRLGRWRGMAV